MFSHNVNGKVSPSVTVAINWGGGRGGLLLKEDKNANLPALLIKSDRDLVSQIPEALKVEEFVNILAHFMSSN